MAHAAAHPDLLTAFAFFLNWPSLAHAARLLIDWRDEVDGDPYEFLTPAAETVAEKHPLSTTVALRAMIDFTLTEGRQKRYGDPALGWMAVKHLRIRLASDNTNLPEEFQKTIDGLVLMTEASNAITGERLRYLARLFPASPVLRVARLANDTDQTAKGRMTVACARLWRVRRGHGATLDEVFDGTPEKRYLYEIDLGARWSDPIHQTPGLNPSHLTHAHNTKPSFWTLQRCARSECRNHLIFSIGHAIL